MSNIRQAILSDIPHMVALSEVTRIHYAQHQPLFWRKASDSAEKQQLYFEHLLEQSNVIMQVHEAGEGIDGFIIASLAPAPPVYDIGGLNCLIDDFCVLNESMWSTVGKPLLDDVKRIASEQGAVQIVVISGHHDVPKRDFLEHVGLSSASVWYTQKIGDD